MPVRAVLSTFAVCSLLAVGCATHAGTGALVGTGFGAVAGSMIGHAVGDPGAGTLIGAGTGALVGSALGEAEDAREQRDWALAHAHAAEHELHAVQHELHNGDLIRMSQSGLGDDVIIGAVRSRGGSFDLSPDGLITLKSNGVSDAVIVEIQQNASGVVPVSLTGPPVAPVVVVPPRRPSVDVFIGVGPRPGRRGPRFHHHHPRPWCH